MLYWMPSCGCGVRGTFYYATWWERSPTVDRITCFRIILLWRLRVRGVGPRLATSKMQTMISNDKKNVKPCFGLLLVKNQIILTPIVFSRITKPRTLLQLVLRDEYGNAVNTSAGLEMVHVDSFNHAGLVTFCSPRHAMRISIEFTHIRSHRTTRRPNFGQLLDCFD